MSKNTFKVTGDTIDIFGGNLTQMAFATYREDYFEELTSVTWTESNGYLRNGKLGYLHRYIMEKWYGADIVSEMDTKSWVVDHMDNNGYNCEISNLEFLSTRHNVAKGQTFDVDARELRHDIAVAIFKDFSTKLYQITMFFNKLVIMQCGESGHSKPIQTMKLLYDCDYKLVINEAESILLQYSETKRFDASKLKCIDKKIEYSDYIKLKEDEVGRAFVFRDGKTFIIPGNNVWIHKADYDEGWTPPEML